MKVAFALTAHTPTDERVWFQQAETLREAGCEVFVVSSRCKNSDLPNVYCFEGMEFSKKETIRKIADFLKNIQPEIIICDNPIAILAAKKYKKILHTDCKIIYDITEWYPSRKYVTGISFCKKIIKIVALTAISIYSSFFVNGFIFGEYYKSVPFRRIFFWKKYIYLPYYADIEKISIYPQKDISKNCILAYFGLLTEEKGFQNVMKTAINCAKHLPDTQFLLKIISNEYFEMHTNLPDNLKIDSKLFLPYESYCEELGKSDIFFDLRKTDWENTRCLPIKLFYYMAAARPVIYSDLKAIRKEVPEIEQFGILVEPDNTEKMVLEIEKMIRNKDYYHEKCENARKFAEEKYNWKKIEQNLVRFVFSY